MLTLVDIERIRRLLERLYQYKKSLDRLSAFSETELLQDLDRLASIKYHFIVSIECCLDIANHIIASERFRAPADYADSIKVLTENTILDESLGNKMKNAARFRNRLVHIYWDIADDLVIQYLFQERDVLESFTKAIARFVGTD